MLVSSPESFYYAVEGYYRKEENHMMLMRNVAQFASAGFVKNDDFNKAWPLPKKYQQDVIKKVWGSAEEVRNLRAQIEKAHGIKLKFSGDK